MDYLDKAKLIRAGTRRNLLGNQLVLIGAGQGTFQSQTEREYYDLVRGQYLRNKNCKGSGLTGNKADAAVAAQSFFSVVLTNENPKHGPLRVAAEHGGKVLYLANFDQSVLSLREYINAFQQQP